MMVRVHHGFVCHNAINAVLLAQSGVTGARKVFTGKGGFFDLIYFWDSEYEPLTEALGTTWEFLKAAVKLYACCYCSHSPITGCMELISKNRIDPEEIKEITIELDPGSEKTVCDPPGVCWNPQTMVEAQFSLPFAVLTAIIKGKVFLDDYTQEEIRSERVRQFMTKIKATANETLRGFESIVTIALKDGAKHTQRTNVNEIKGGFSNQASWEEIVNKFKSFLPYSAVKIPRSNIDEIVEKCETLEHVTNMRQIVNLICSSPPNWYAPEC